MFKVEALDLGEAWRRPGRAGGVLPVAFWVSKPFTPGFLTSYWSIQFTNWMHLKP